MFGMDVSIIIVNYNTKKLTSDCINSIYEKTTGIRFEVIVVDNNSSDGSQDVFLKDSRIIFVEAGENLGFGKANNKGVEIASGKYVFFLNSDTILVNNAVKLFYDYSELNSYKRIGAVGCLLENLDGENVHSYGYFPSIRSFVKGFFEAGYRRMLGKPQKAIGAEIFGVEQQVDYVTGADVFVNREIINKYGCFDPDFFMYYEDTEMQKRWVRNGVKNVIIKGPRIIHLEGCSTKNNKQVLNERKLYMGLRSQRIYFKKTETRLGFLIYRLVSLLNLLPILRFKYNFRQFCTISKIIFDNNPH